MSASTSEHKNVHAPGASRPRLPRRRPPSTAYKWLPQGCA
jgi:hypothetical protein